jgi:hypothetical protein
MDRLDTLCALARAAVPSATGLDCYVRLHQDGVHPALYEFYAQAFDPGKVLEKVKVRAISAEQAAQDLKTAWRKARRAYDVAQVLSDCRRLADGNLDSDQAAVIENELLHCYWTAFDAIAGRARKSAQALSTTHQQAA